MSSNYSDYGFNKKQLDDIRQFEHDHLNSSRMPSRVRVYMFLADLFPKSKEALTTMAENEEECSGFEEAVARAISQKSFVPLLEWGERSYSCCCGILGNRTHILPLTVPVEKMRPSPPTVATTAQDKIRTERSGAGAMTYSLTLDLL